MGCLPQLHGTIPPGGWMVEGQPYAITISEKNGDLNGARLHKFRTSTTEHDKGLCEQTNKRTTTYDKNASIRPS